jgi:hypothetical protein
MLGDMMKITVNPISNNRFEVVVIGKRGQCLKAEKHADLQSAYMAAKFLSVEYNCPIDNNE